MQLAPEPALLNKMEQQVKSLNLKKHLFPIASFLAASLSAITPMQAQATLINFTTMPAGQVSIIGDATFSLAGTGEMGNPSVFGFGVGLLNSTDGVDYPTNTILRVEFATDVTGLKWVFNNRNIKATTYTIYDAMSNVLATGLNSYPGNVNYDFSSLTNARRIDWNNGGNNWLFDLGQIEYVANTVPEPGTLALLGLSLGGVFFARRRSSQA
jgi:PEP-CTERM motif